MRQIYFISLILSLLTPQIANACEPNPYSYSTLTRQDWTELKRVMRSTGISINREPVTKYDITAIIGYPNECSVSANGRIEKCIWIDGRDCKKKIKASFRDNELSKIRKSGF